LRKRLAVPFLCTEGTSEDMESKLREFFARNGAIGGRATGACKVRGDRAYYQRLAEKAIKARAKLATENPNSSKRRK
jgi:hypothetical protein